MSFRCDACHEAQDPRVKPISIVARRRDKEYMVSGGKVLGWEVEREEYVCASCYDASRQGAESAPA